MNLPWIRLKLWGHTDGLSVVDPSLEFGMSTTAGVDPRMAAHWFLSVFLFWFLNMIKTIFPYLFKFN
jgi:hypothetical protein